VAAPILVRRPDLDGPAVVAELIRREEESSTAIADGIAIPHAKPAGPNVVTAGFGRSLTGVDFDSLDGKPTTLIVAIVSPASNPELHVKWLSHIARVLSDPETRKAILAATSVAQLLDALRRREQTFDDAPEAR
jgi:mannitol/fructose-specific phosphotransferase system IIA component (Ntr-type)